MSMWNASSDFDYYDEIGQSEEAHEDNTSPCGCGDPRCRIDGNDASNVTVSGKWYAADCAGLCWNCGRIDTMAKLFPVGSGRLVHDGCPTPAMEEDRVLAAKADEQRDDFNEVRR